ncbi:unnamed protein product [Moneuplotes crassus]|uniref:Uncharacterized protein n=1 Tax=Euplotes crassus TaxID=5936 RepID=A0AAD2DAG5_EUPCR|nr:unnamed protein product [Moneuplotes crassus]
MEEVNNILNKRYMKKNITGKIECKKVPLNKIQRRRKERSNHTGLFQSPPFPTARSRPTSPLPAQNFTSMNPSTSKDLPMLNTPRENLVVANNINITLQLDSRVGSPRKKFKPRNRQTGLKRRYQYSTAREKKSHEIMSENQTPRNFIDHSIPSVKLRNASLNNTFGKKKSPAPHDLINMPQIKKYNGNLHFDPTQCNLFETKKYIKNLEKKPRRAYGKGPAFKTMCEMSNNDLGVSEESVQHLKDQVNHAMNILDSNLEDLLPQRSSFTPIELIEFLRSTFLLTKSDSMKLCNYFRENNGTPMSKTGMNKGQICAKIRQFAGDCQKIPKDLSKILNQTVKIKKAQKSLIEDFKQLCEKNFIYPLEVVGIFQKHKVIADYKMLGIILLQKSSSIHQIKPEVIEKDLIPCLRLTGTTKKITFKDLKRSDSELKKKFSSQNKEMVTLKRSQDDTSYNISIADLTEITKASLIKLADAFFAKNLSLLDICHGDVFDKVIDGKEYQIIKRKELISSFQKLGIVFSIPEYLSIKEFFSPTIQDFVDLNKLHTFLEQFGIKEDKPESTKHLNFDILEPCDIRVFNRIINHIEFHKLNSSQDMLNPEDVSRIHCVTSTKEAHLEVVRFTNLEKELRKVRILHPHEELSESMVQFLEISADHSELCMLRKLSKAIRLISESNYYRYYGTKMRVFRPDPPKESEKPSDNIYEKKESDSNSKNVFHQHLKKRVDEIATGIMSGVISINKKQENLTQSNTNITFKSNLKTTKKSTFSRLQSPPNHQNIQNSPSRAQNQEIKNPLKTSQESFHIEDEIQSPGNRCNKLDKELLRKHFGL